MTYVTDQRASVHYQLLTNAINELGDASVHATFKQRGALPQLWVGTIDLTGEVYLTEQHDHHGYHRKPNGKFNMVVRGGGQRGNYGWANKSWPQRSNATFDYAAIAKAVAAVYLRTVAANAQRAVQESNRNAAALVEFTGSWQNQASDDPERPVHVHVRSYAGWNLTVEQAKVLAATLRQLGMMEDAA